MTHWLRNTACACLAGAIALGVFARPAPAATPKQTDDAIKKAKEYIYSQMGPNNWEAVQAPKGDGQADPDGKQWGGTTGLAVYGLLAAGENPQDPRLAKAIEWLKTAPMEGHYACGMRAQVWTFLKNEREAKLASTPDFKNLLTGLLSDKRIGMYSYYVDFKTGKPQADWWDHSVSQYGVLGMWACEQAGQEVPTRYWEIVDARWKKDQKNDGGWSYNDNNNAITGTMTAAGVATLFITQDYLLQKNDWGRCNGGIRNEHIERGLAWMDRHVEAMLKGGGHYYYAMYGIERIGVASGRKYFGTVDWYQLGADELVKKQNANGSWGAAGGHHNPKGVPDTVFSTLFLVRGRAPVIMNKLEYGNVVAAAPAPAGAAPAPAPAAPKPAAAPKKGGQDDPWNERPPRDVANFTHWSTKQTENYLNWQIVNLRVPAHELNDAPILYISGSQALDFSEAELNKLREFGENGGLILGNSDCSNPLFTKSFHNLGRKLFPKYEFRILPDNHSIFVDQQFRRDKWRTKPKVEGLSNGVRELMIIIPEADPARAWQTRAEKTREELFQVVQNIFLYTISKAELRFRGDTHIVLADPKVQPGAEVKLVRLMAGDNPDPEPGGWRRMGNLLHNQHKVRLTIEQAKLGEGKLKDAKIAHLTGTTRLKFSPEQQQELKAFVAGGGTLVVDAAGGSSEFADSAEAELAAAFGQQPGNVGAILDPTHAVFNVNGAKVENVAYRSFVKGKLAGRLNAPRLRGIEQGGRVAVFYSREDLSAGIVGNQVDGVLGYRPETATDIMRNIVLYAGGAKPAVAANPEPAK